MKRNGDGRVGLLDYDIIEARQYEQTILQIMSCHVISLNMSHLPYALPRLLFLHAFTSLITPITKGTPTGPKSGK